MSSSPDDQPEATRQDDRGLEALLARFGGLLAATIRRACPGTLGIDTQDIEQDARIRLWRALGRATEGELGASYVKKVATTAAIDAIRSALARRDRRSLDEVVQAPDGEERPASGDVRALDEQTPEDEARRRQVGDTIVTAISELGADRRRAVRLHLHGLQSPEIARLTGWSETKTRTLISRGLAELRRTLSEKGVQADDGA